MERTFSQQVIAEQYFAVPDPGVRELSQCFLDPGSRVLDAGAGFGRNARYLAAEGHDVVAIDQNLEYVEEMRRLRVYGSAAVKLSVELADFRQPELEPESFDAVFMTCVLHELPSAREAMKALDVARGLTRPMGYNFIKAYIGYEDERAAADRIVVLEPGAVERSYDENDWAIAHKSRVTQPLTWQAGRPSVHSYDEIVARKPASSPHC